MCIEPILMFQNNFIRNNYLCGTNGLYGVLPFDGDSVFQIIGFDDGNSKPFPQKYFPLQKILKNLYSFSSCIFIIQSS